MRAAFRVDASRTMGTGHVMRCLTLADALAASGAECVFVSRMTEGNIHDLVRARGYEQLVLPATARSRPAAADDPPHAAWLDADWDRDAEETVAALIPSGPFDWLVVDHYALDERWHGRGREAASRLMVIDDVADRRLDCDMLLDQNLNFEGERRYEGLVPQGCRLMIGPTYALLRPVFAALREREETPRDGFSVLVFLGGSDPDGITLLALEALEETRSEAVTADVVVGSANPHASAIEAWGATRPWIRMHGGGGEIAHLMAESAVAIGAGGSTTWERACVGLPAVMVVIADNQRKIAEAVEAVGAAVVAGDWHDIDAGDIASPLRRLLEDETLRASMREAAMKLTDGKGAARVAEAMLG